MILDNEKNIHLMWRQSLERVSSAERDNARIFSTLGKMSPNQKVKRQQEFVARKRLISRLKLKDKTNAVCSEQFN